MPALTLFSLLVEASKQAAPVLLCPSKRLEMTKETSIAQQTSDHNLSLFLADPRFWCQSLGSVQPPGLLEPCSKCLDHLLGSFSFLFYFYKKSDVKLIFYVLFSIPEAD